MIHKQLAVPLSHIVGPMLDFLDDKKNVLNENVGFDFNGPLLFVPLFFLYQSIFITIDLVFLPVSSKADEPKYSIVDFDNKLPVHEES
jgi:hypothetical protein